MRLSKIRIAGFKSFVDPVTLDLRSNLVGILGPNGCGKSNTIDAVRWVMGESSAKHLRGQSMDDVIFNGSSARKPVGVASVELVFDNSAGQLGGAYANYQEIAIKRQVSRDGSSKFFLNGSRCRRRDITDIFLGTGLGPRSYAIIEQGMISRMIEAKPEELRITLEEAAGISRYKDRRKETETRIASTRENLERLTDLREELDKNLQKLDKQAKAAERFRELEAEHSRLNALHLYLQLHALQQQHDDLIEQLRQASERYQAQLAQVEQQTQHLESLREQASVAHEQRNQVQDRYYQASTEVSRLEQSIQFQQQTRQRQQENLQRLQQALDEAQRDVTQDRKRLVELEQQTYALEPKLALTVDQVKQWEASLWEAEQAFETSQTQWQQLQQQLAEPSRQAQVEKTRIEQFEKQIQHEQQRLSRLQQDLACLPPMHELNLSHLEAELDTVVAQHTEAEQQLHQQTEQLNQTRQALRALQIILDQERSQRQTLQGKIAALAVLQQSDLSKDNELQQTWLTAQHWQAKPRLAEVLEVETGWELAIETVLERLLDAPLLEDLSAWLAEQHHLESNGLRLLAANACESSFAANSLAQKIKQPLIAQQLLKNVFYAENLAEALAQREKWTDDISYVTRDGVWLSKLWLQLPPLEQAHNGVLQRQQKIRELGQQLDVLEASLAQRQAEQDQLRLQLEALEQAQQQLQSDTNRLHRQESELKSRLSHEQQRLTQVTQRRTQLESDIQESLARQVEQQAEWQHSEKQYQLALALLETLTEQYEVLSARRDNQQQQLQHLRSQLRHAQTQQHELHFSLETCRTQTQATELQLERAQNRLEVLEAQHEELTAQVLDVDQPLELLAENLSEALVQRDEIAQTLQVAKQALQNLEQAIRSQDQLRQQAEREAEVRRSKQEQLKLDWQAVNIRQQNLQAQLAQTGFEQSDLERDLAHTETADLLLIQQRLDQLAASIKRLGAINLAALDEYREQHERKVYLDEQHADLISALETLEAVMRKIDRETRALFKETFEQVNNRLGEMFPRLFGGGECYLEMTEQDLLTTGIRIMARPPGKRLSSIYLMSGGEKALTAVALVFAIFELNPAPFCMLDEVDAPLDEANVGRFCSLVRHMAERVQFIFITHNKTTMELAENLIGVTMREAGVSRLVSVDVAEAVKLAGV
ncbi:chromosome segregation protein SMC [Thiolinea disciformis]|uniref:chromosome segregation protein SMC n=1 Tax=Thiolinea disciformis TaxID=125614 RepID=UPI000370B651|nr:chromosome segregation protein SMC [Thiolinea disciformis]